MSRTDEQPTVRVQVYFENPKVEKALRREAHAAKIPISRAAERAIERGLAKRPHADPEDRLLNLDRALRDHMRSTVRDISILQELVVELARMLIARLPDTAADQDPLALAAVEARIGRMLDAAASRIAAGGSIPAQPEAAGGDTIVPLEPRSFHAVAR